jgi:hypothetical protein
VYDIGEKVFKGGIVAINSVIPQSSKLCIAGCVFKSSFGIPTVGKYDFTNYLVGGNRSNVAVDIGMAMNANYLYFFHQMNFSLSIDEGVFLRSIDPSKVPILSIRDSTDRKNIFHAPFRMFRYFENAAVDSFHYNSNADAFIIADFQSVLIQVAETVGVADIYAQVSFSIYEIKDNDFIQNYKREENK